jgi:hypothetical protein
MVQSSHMEQTDGVDGSDWIWRALATALLAAMAVRLLGSIVAGLIEIADHESVPFGNARIRASNILTTLGAAGDVATAVLGLGALGLVVLATRASGGEPLGVRGRPGMLRWLSVLRLLMATTAVLALCSVVGFALFGAADFSQAAFASRTILDAAVSLGALLVAAGGYVAAGRIADVALYGDEDDWVVFAIDRKTAEVRAFLSQAEALRRIPWVSLEEDEYELVRDDGRVLSVEAGPPARLVESDQSKAAELSEKLRQYAERTELSPATDGTPEPLDYALPMHARQWLDMWPHWLRPIGMLVRKLQGL